MKIYVAGKVTDNPGYKEQFEQAAAKLRSDGHAVMNPAVLPEGFEYEEYMHICFAMIDTCEAIALLPNWRESPGAKREYEYAVKSGKEVFIITRSGVRRITDGRELLCTYSQHQEKMHTGTGL